MPYKVFIDDNFHYGDESERIPHGEFPTLEAARAACRRIVDDYLASARERGMTAGDLMASYAMFGDDPFIVAVGEAETGVLFSGRDYARQRCEEICG